MIAFLTAVHVTGHYVRYDTIENYPNLTEYQDKYYTRWNTQCGALGGFFSLSSLQDGLHGQQPALLLELGLGHGGWHHGHALHSNIRCRPWPHLTPTTTTTDGRTE